jgi:uncharacterized membrane protein YhhN
MKTTIISIIYFLTGILFILMPDGLSFLAGTVLKALIIPLLMLLLLANIKPLKNNLHRIMLAGLFFSWGGDIFLEFTGRDGFFFILGLGSFLMAHIMYFSVFFLTPGENVIFNKRIYLLIPLIIYGAGLLYYLYGDLGNMRIPVVLYAIVILTMIAGALNRLEKVNKTSYYLVLSGAILFVISDSAIAVNKFSRPFESSGIVVMSTYIMAQYLIITGYIRQFIK